MTQFGRRGVVKPAVSTSPVPPVQPVFKLDPSAGIALFNVVIGGLMWASGVYLAGDEGRISRATFVGTGICLSLAVALSVRSLVNSIRLRKAAAGAFAAFETSVAVPLFIWQLLLAYGHFSAMPWGMGYFVIIYATAFVLIVLAQVLPFEET